MATNFSDWLTQKFLEWQAREGKRKTLEEFAAYVGVSRPLLNMWMNGIKKKPGMENVRMLAEIFGDDIYDVLDLPRPNFYLQKINRLFEHLPEEVQKRFAEEAEQYEAQNLSNKSATLDQQRKKRKVQ